MTVAVISLFVSMIVELMLFMWLWEGRRALAALAIGASTFATVLMMLMGPNVWSFVMFGANLYRVFNLIRLANGRLHERYARQTGAQASRYLIGWQMLVILLWAGSERYGVVLSPQGLWLVLACGALLSSALLLASTVRNLRKTRPIVWHEAYSDKELPTLTVAIPARNETLDLQQCLESLIANDYPKLEILVLDDCSQNRRTPEIIRGFAHDGVRFVQGDVVVREGWLAKNQAYEKLAEESSGELLLFCGVDMRFTKQSLRELVSIMLSRKKHMVATVPLRANGAGGQYSLVQPMRYFWELMPPRRMFGRPPVLSTCWLIERKFLERAGGFKAVDRMIVPEAYFAQRALEDDGYSFVRIADSSVKAATEQRETAIRTRYPQLHRRIELVAGMALAELILLVLPFALLLAGAFTNLSRITWLLAALACLLLVVSYELLVRAIRFQGAMFGLVAFPLMVLMDIGLLHYSMWKYEFSSVDWKGRNVCVPVMRVIPRLPRM